MIDIATMGADLKLANDGIWYSSEHERVSYPTDGNDSTFAIEDDSFWFRHRNDCISALGRLLILAGATVTCP
jgi:hypothetical protein